MARYAWHDVLHSTREESMLTVRRAVHPLARVVVAVIACITSLVGCTPSSPTPPAPTPSSTSADQTTSPPAPTISRTDRNIAAAKKSFAEGFAEIIRVMKAGGTTEPTPIMRATMTGDYLKLNLQTVAPGVYAKGTARLVGVSAGAGSDATLPLTACEDLSDYRLFDSKTDEDRTPKGSPLLVQKVEAVRASDGTWKIARFLSTKRVTRHEWAQQPCVTG